MTVIVGSRTAGHDVDPMFLARWSPRAFTAEAMPQETLLTLFEAALGASAFNGQPWRFIYAHRDTPDWDRLFATLIPANQAWVRRASVLAYIVSDRFRRAPDKEPVPVGSHSFDAGAAWAYLALEASRIGWAAHGMAGFDPQAAYAALGVPEADYRVEAAIAIGKPASADVLDEPYRGRESPSPRRSVDEFAFQGRLKVDGA